MRAAGPLALLFLTALTDADAGVDVRVEGGRVSVRADGAPISEVLERLSQQLGMKVTYEGGPPRVLVSTALVNRTPAEAVLGVLQGLGLDYVACMDPSGARVEALVVSAPAARASGPAPPRPAAVAGRPAAAPAEQESAHEEEEEDSVEASEVGEGQGQPDDPDKPPRTGPAGVPTTGVPAPVLPRGVGTAPAFPVSPFAPQPPPPTPTPEAPVAPPAPENDDGGEEQ